MFATVPFDLNPFYQSQRMKNIMAAAGKDFSLNVMDMDPDLLYIMGCSTILQAHYKFPVGVSIPLVMEIPPQIPEIVFTIGF